MMRWLLLPALTLVAGGIAAAYLRDDPGYVLIQIAGYTLESSVAGLALLAAVATAIAIIGGRIVGTGVSLPSKVGNYFQDRRLQHARRQLRLGLTQLAAGNWDRAEVELLRRIADTDEPGPNYIYAADAAHQLGKPERRDEYLRLADGASSANHHAVLLKRAQMWAQDQRPQEAMEALEQLLQSQPQNKAALSLRLQLLAQDGRWDVLRTALASARNVVDAELLDNYALQTHHALLSQARASGRLESLRAAWQEVGKAQQQDTGLIAHYAQLCHEMNADADALRLITVALRSAWHPQLALIYGQLDGGDVVRQLAKVEQWLGQHGEKAELLLIAGRLCLRNRLWGRARSYFEACLRSYPSPEIRLELGKLLIQQGEDAKVALELFRDGLESSLSPHVRTAPASLVDEDNAPLSLDQPR